MCAHTATTGGIIILPIIFFLEALPMPGHCGSNSEHFHSLARCLFLFYFFYYLASSRLLITSFCVYHRVRYLDKIEHAVANGDCMLIENIAETVDPVLDHLLGRNTIKKGK